MHQGSQDPFAQLFETGWQSWSTSYPKKKRLPLYNYPPFPLGDSVQGVHIPQVSLKKSARGWCSWYYYGKHIDEQVILRQSEWFRSNPLEGFEYILVDDGWATYWGDWRSADRRKFPSGLKALSLKIQAFGHKPGIWLAPFLVSPHSSLVHKHPGWLVRHGGRPLEGVRFAPFDRYFPYRKYILDITQPAVVEYLEGVLNFLLVECGFQLIKLDFLYGMYNNPKLTTSESDKLLRAFLLNIRQRYPGVYTIACGCPLLPAVGAVDSMRIGPDILVPSMQSVPLVGKMMNRYCYQSVIHNIKSRSWTKKYWNLDYDAFICRENTGISDQQVHVQSQLIKESMGNIFLGDDMYALPKEKVQQLIKPLFQ
jgi:alpha-galactosidase